MSSDFLLFAQHGWADTNHAIANLAHSIAPTGTIIAPNLGWFRTWVQIEPLIQKVDQVATDALQRYPRHSWHIIGHSMGGLIWVELLHRHPDWWSRVQSLTLVGAPIGGSDLGRMIALFSRDMSVAKDLGINRRAMAEAIAAQIPTLVIAGNSDGGSDGTVTVECTKIRRATFVTLPGIAHAPLKDHPLVGSAIQSFWHAPKIAPPESNSPSQQVIQRLRQVPGMTDAHYRDAHRGQVLRTLEDGATVRAWMNPLGAPHVFVIGEKGDCLYGGYVGWLNKADLQIVLHSLRKGDTQP